MRGTSLWVLCLWWTASAQAVAPWCTSADQYAEGAYRRTKVQLDSRSPVPDYPCKKVALPQTFVHDVFRWQPDATEREDERRRSYAASQWDWVPRTCALKEFDAASFVRGMRGGTVLFVGDSISEFMADELACLLDAAGLVESSRRNGYFDGSSLVVLKDGLGWIRYVRNDLLVDAETGKVEDNVSGHHRHQHDWPRLLLTLSDRDVLVLNSGHHWGQNYSARPPDLLKGTIRYSQMVRTVLGILEAHPFRGRVAYRTTVGGHVGCIGAQGPLASYADASRAETQYNWSLMDAGFLDHMWALMLPRFPNVASRFTLLNTSMTKLRPDGHIEAQYLDCLHYLTPGPQHVWVQLLHHLVVGAAATI